MPRKTNARDIKGATIHPRSRKAAQLHRIAMRQGRMMDQKTARVLNKVCPVLDRIAWFQLRLGPDSPELTDFEVHDVVREFLSRHDDERAKLEAECRPGRPRPKRLDEIAMVEKLERAEYETGAGLAIPDMTNEDALSRLKQWDGQRESIDLLSLVRLCKDGRTRSVKYLDC